MILLQIIVDTFTFSKISSIMYVNVKINEKGVYMSKKQRITTRIGTTVEDCLGFYCEEYAVDEKLKATDNIFYNSLPLYEFFKNKSIRDLTELDIRKYKKWRRKEFKKKRGKEIANNTLGRELTMLKTALNVAVSDDYKLIKLKQEKYAIKRLTIKVPKVESRTEEYIPSIKEVERIIKYLPKHLYELAFCAHRLGYRGSELLGLTFGNISWTEREIRLPTSKNKKGRNTPLYKEILKFLIKMRYEAVKTFGRRNLNDVFIFRDKYGKERLDKRNVYYYWDNACIKARCAEINENGKTKPKYNFHDLRKAAVKYLRITYNFDRYMIQKMYTGHESLEIFEKIYNAITTEDLEHYKKVALAV